jgi:penicillin-binding protein 1B
MPLLTNRPMELNTRPPTRDSSALQKFPGIGLFPGLPRLEAAFLATELAVFLLGICLFVHLSRDLNRYTDARLLAGGGTGGAAIILAAPAQVWVGEMTTPTAIAERLRNGLYTEGVAGSDVGTFKLAANRLEIHPGPASFFHHGQIQEGPVELSFHNGRITGIESLDHGTSIESYLLEPEVITTLSGYARSEQQLVRYQELPKVLIDAVIATEDHRFFSHHGVNAFRLVKAALADLRGDGYLQGGSTVTMQLARNLFLTPRRTVKRKAEEICLALFLETRLTKQQIFELYANRLYLGQQGNLGIFGFGDASQAYFHKDVSKLNLPEAAFLAGLIRGPNLYSPYKYPQRSLERRNFVLRQMVETGFIAPAEAERAMRTALNTAKPTLAEARQEGFFEDMVTAELRTHFSEPELHFRGLRVYTTLDLDLEKAASDAARVGSAELDRQLRKPKLAKHAAATESDQPQIAMAALDPHTGDVRAAIGGRDYSASQLNHLMARRQPGSSFKPFVYAAALNSGVDGSSPTITPATVLNDEPTQFRFGNKRDKPYEPRDYKEDYHGTVTVREALTDSLNVPTVSLAQMIGYDKVRNLAIAAGFNSQLEATPAIALGAYVATPLEVAGAYTIFANQGKYVPPRCIVEVDDASGAPIWSNPVITRRVLDPRVAYLMVNLLEGVIDAGTGAGVRARGFSLPAAGKTGTSHDGWFAGFTSNLLAVVWVGYDDDRELNLTGAQSALPLWTEFMKRAVEDRPYRNPAPFTAPPGIVTVPIETPASSTDSADWVTTRNEVFIQGTEPPSPEETSEPGLAAEGEASHEAATDDGVQRQQDGPPHGEHALPLTVTPVSQTLLQALPIQENTPTTPTIESPRSGWLRIQTNPPGLQVFVDAKLTGLSPVTLSLPAGEHTYKVDPPPGRAPIERTVQITAGATAIIKIHY